MKYSYSTNEENYYGQFDTIEECIAEVIASYDDDQVFWVGENHPPTQPEELFDCEGWLDRISECDEEYCNEWAQGWNRSTREHREELNELVKPILAAWLDRHDLRPKFWNIGAVTEYRVVDGKAVKA